MKPLEEFEKEVKLSMGNTGLQKETVLLITERMGKIERSIHEINIHLRAIYKKLGIDSMITEEKADER